MPRYEMRKAFLEGPAEVIKEAYNLEVHLTGPGEGGEEPDECWFINRGDHLTATIITGMYGTARLVGKPVWHEQRARLQGIPFSRIKKG